MTNDSFTYRYDARLAHDIEKKWQGYWADNNVFAAPNPVGDFHEPNSKLLNKPKRFVQDMFPYPSGAGLHVGHPLGYISTDVFARYSRHNGFNVLHTLGYDAFGLPAEQYAIQTGTHPRETTEKNIHNMERQLGQLGLGHDKRRAIRTIDKDYYRWTQWIFLTIYNSYFDEDEQKAKPISELEKKLESRTDLTAEEKADFIDSKRLVYRTKSLVNWCPGLGTVLANEEVTADGRSERGNFPVFRKELSQWMMRITAYGDRLIDDLALLDWPEKVKSMQRNWIGRSTGAEVDFTIRCDAGAGDDSTSFGAGAGEAEHSVVSVYTTRPDTLFGATYMVLSPEHPLVDKLLRTQSERPYAEGTNPQWTLGKQTPAEAVDAYRLSIAAKSDLERQENKEKTGVYLGVRAVNPLSGAEVPVFISDYVLMGYGTGAIMAVPAHDTRDYEFATVFGLPIVPVLDGGNIEEEAFTEDGPHINSDFLNGLNKEDGIAAAIERLEENGTGRAKKQFKLRDWLFARQRYWGEPFPIVYDDEGRAHALPEDMLPVELPDVEDYKPVTADPNDRNSEPHPPLAKATDWVNVTLDLGDGPKHYTRDTNVMPQWAGSSWYQLRYIDPTNSERFVDLANERYWTGPQPDLYGPQDPGGVDLYVGGVEHAVLHLLYARFWHKVLFDLGCVSSKEPYRKLFNQGYIQAYAYTDKRGVYVPAAEVEEKDGKFFYQGEEVNQEYGKMGKSLKNAVSPDQVCEDFGADTLRLYEMAMGPLDMSRPWATKDVIGSHRFLQRLWRLAVNEETGEPVLTDEELTADDEKLLHRTIAGVRDDYEHLRINTVVAKLIELTNHLTKHYPGGAPRAALEPLTIMVSPIAPHIAEELWSRLGHTGGITYAPFPTFDESLLVDASVELPVQVNGKVRAHITVAVEASRTDVLAAAKEAAASQLTGKTVVKEIVVPGRLVNLVVK